MCIHLTITDGKQVRMARKYRNYIQTNSTDHEEETQNTDRHTRGRLHFM